MPKLTGTKSESNKIAGAKVGVPEYWQRRGREISPLIAPINWTMDQLREWAQTLQEAVEDTPAQPSIEDLEEILIHTDMAESWRMLADELAETRANITAEIARRKSEERLHRLMKASKQRKAAHA